MLPDALRSIDDQGQVLRLCSAWGLTWLDRLRLTTLAIPFAVLLALDDAHRAIAAMLALVALLVWQWLFAHVRQFPVSSSLAQLGVYALLTALALPLDLGSWQLILCVSFGYILGELIFGGRGFSFLHPVTVSAAFCFYAFGVDPAAVEPNWLVLLLAPIAFILWKSRLLSSITLLSLLVGALLMLLASSHPLTDSALSHPLAATLLLYLACDPVSGPATRAARPLYGLLVGALAIAGGSESPVQAVVNATLLGSLAAPLLDSMVIAIERRRRQHPHASD